MNPTSVIAIITIGEQVVQLAITDVAGFYKWLSQNSDAAATAQLQANDPVFAAAIAEEQAKAGGQ